jgi:hypothetical protein
MALFAGAVKSRKCTPTVGLLCWKKPKPSPLCTWLNIMPK